MRRLRQNRERAGREADDALAIVNAADAATEPSATRSFSLIAPPWRVIAAARQPVRTVLVT